MANQSAAFAALADPTRREIFERLAAAPRAVGELASELPVSRPAVSQHLKVLKDAGLVIDVALGTRRVYEIDPNGLGVLRAWLDRFWTAALDSYKAEVERQEAPGEGSGGPSSERPRGHAPRGSGNTRTKRTKASNKRKVRT